MAGDWIKMECCTPEKSEVLAITAGMGWDDPDLTVGKLFRVWRWFDQQTTDGNAKNVTSALLDRIAGVTGFAQSMSDVDWLSINEDGLSLPNFDFHNGASAKKRAETAKRVTKHRSNASVTDSALHPEYKNVTSALAREEKRREEKRRVIKDINAVAIAAPDGVSTSVWSDFLRHRKTKKAVVTQTAIDGIAREAIKAGVTLNDALAMCCERGWTGFNSEWLAEKQGNRSINPATKASPGKHTGFQNLDYKTGINEDGTFA